MRGKRRGQSTARWLLAIPPRAELPPDVGDEHPAVVFVRERHTVGCVGELVFEKQRRPAQGYLNAGQHLPSKPGELVFVGALTLLGYKSHFRVWEGGPGANS